MEPERARGAVARASRGRGADGILRRHGLARFRFRDRGPPRAAGGGQTAAIALLEGAAEVVRAMVPGEQEAQLRVAAKIPVPDVRDAIEQTEAGKDSR